MFLRIVVCVLALSATAPAASLKAGASAVDITPQVFPVNMPGGFSANYATNAHDPLHARALVFSDGKKTIAMVVADTISGSTEALDEAKAIAAAKTGIATNDIMVSATHTHSAVRTSYKTGPEPEVAYRKRFVAGIANSIVQAHAILQPAQVGYAKHPLPEEVFNRRWHLKPGKMPLNPFGKMDTVKMNPGRSETVLDRAAGPTDPDVSIISVQNARRRPLALFANYALHYVGATPRGQVSADYFGEFARLMPSRLRGDKDFVAMLSNGASGDINNIPFTVVRPPRERFEQIRIVAGKTADAAWFASKKIRSHESDATVDMREREIALKYRKPTKEQIAEAKKVLAVKDKAAIAKLPRLAQNYASRTLQAAGRPESLTIKLQAIRVGDIAVVGIPFETLVEIGLELKARSPFKNTIVVGLANGRHGYLPTPEQHKLGGYETWLGTCVVEKDSSVIIIRNLLELLAELRQ
ncbi:MAG: neutral/alkaline non-lysosomal ceramidase N-terminal domain-containing protein [Limisphaerales bacterium]